MQVHVFVKVEVLSHEHRAHHTHPRAIEIAALGHCLTCFQEDDHSLNGTQSGNIFEAVLMLLIGC